MIRTRKVHVRPIGTKSTRHAFLPSVAVGLATVACLFCVFTYETAYQDDPKRYFFTEEAIRTKKARSEYIVSLPLALQIGHEPRSRTQKPRQNPNTLHNSKPLHHNHFTHHHSRYGSSKSQNRERVKQHFNSCQWAKYKSWPYVDEFQSLSPYRNKLLYIKTPKSSSSTIAHILQRYTTRQGLIVGYPDFKRDVWTFTSSEMFQDAAKRAGVQPVMHLDALVSHMVFNSSAVEEALGTKRPFRITSVREPIARAWSMFLHGLEYGIPEFSFNAKTPWTFARNLDPDLQTQYARGWGHGFKSRNIDELTDFYDAIVVSDRVTESLVALAPKLGLKLSDLLFVSQKTQIHMKKPSDLVNLEQKRAIDRTLASKSKLDKAFYESAKRKLNLELYKLPKKVTEVLNDIGKMKLQVVKACGQIDPEDNSCLKPAEVVWDGNQVCMARCIEQWARKHVECNNHKSRN